MAASAHPSAGGHSNGGNGNNNSGNSNAGGQENGNGGAGVSATENSVVGPTRRGLSHNPGLSLDWAPEEQSTLEDLLSKYASDPPHIRYAKIAQSLRDKTVRDVALRCRWMSKKENGKRRKDDNNSRKNKEKKEKISDSLLKSSQAASRSNGPPYIQSVMSMDNDDGISYKSIGGPAGQLLQQNANALDQISANFSACKIHENINLFCQARSNILSILNDPTIDLATSVTNLSSGLDLTTFKNCLNDMPEIMRQMPPLPVKLNEELANSILPVTSLPKKS